MILAHAYGNVAWPMAKTPHDGGNNDDGLDKVAVTP
jgi:hypothetical protein